MLCLRSKSKSKCSSGLVHPRSLQQRLSLDLRGGHKTSNYLDQCYSTT